MESLLKKNFKKIKSETIKKNKLIVLTTLQKYLSIKFINKTGINNIKLF